MALVLQKRFIHGKRNSVATRVAKPNAPSPAVTIGYPINLAYDYSKVFSSLKHKYNNVGDPYIPSLYHTHSKDEERVVLSFFQQLWQFDPNNAWGYLTHNGTEGNMQGLFVARQLHPSGILYCSQESHYSIHKIANILKLPMKVIRARENGELDYDDFEAQLDKTLPAIICVNMGTTMKGAYDNPRELYRILTKHKMSYYMHADGALMGFVLPFLELDIFYKKALHSISISGHKFLGTPFPCGVFMMEASFLEVISKHIEYIATNDNTISGSRNGHSAVFLSHMIQQKGFEGFRKDIYKCFDTSEYLLNRLQRNNVYAWRNNNSITVVLDRVPQPIIDRWQLASTQTHSHIIVMPHVTRAIVDNFVDDLCREIQKRTTISSRPKSRRKNSQ